MTKYGMVLLVLITLSTQAQRKDFEMFSIKLDENQSIWVQLPAGYDSASEYGVIYVLDADGHFDYMSRYVDYLSKPFAKVIPKLIVVGIRSKSPAWRHKNFTLPGANKAEQGNADQFIGFLKEELIPEINSKFKTTDTRVLAGHSLAGLFALYSLSQATNLFTHIIAASPSVSYGEGKLISLLEQKPLTQKNVKLFFSVAEHDLANYQAYTETFKRHLEGTGFQSWRYEFFEDMDHYSTCPAAFYAGLIQVFKM